MALLDLTVFHARKDCAEEFFAAYRKACGNLMGEFGDIINRAGHEFPALVPTEAAWRQVASSRVSNEELAETAVVDHSKLRSVLAVVQGHIAEILALTPLMTGEPGALTDAFERLDRVATGWRHR